MSPNFKFFVYFSSILCAEFSHRCTYSNVLLIWLKKHRKEFLEDKILTLNRKKQNRYYHFLDLKGIFNKSPNIIVVDIKVKVQQKLVHNEILHPRQKPSVVWHDFVVLLLQYLCSAGES